MDRKIRLFAWVRQLLKKCYPPGYEYGQEWTVFFVLLGIVAAASFRFLVRLYEAWKQLYVVADGKRILIEGAAAKSFTWLAQGHGKLFAPLPLFLAVMAVYRYCYYYHETKSIYLMRRLPKRGVVFKSCVLGSALGIGIGIVLSAVLYLLYFLIYLLVIPAECMPRFV